MLFAALLYRPRVLACQMRLRLVVLCLVCSCATRFGAVGFATAWDDAVGNDCVDVSDRNVTLHDVYSALWFHIADDCVSNRRRLAQVLEWPQHSFGHERNAGRIQARRETVGTSCLHHCAPFDNLCDAYRYFHANRIQTIEKGAFQHLLWLTALYYRRTWLPLRTARPAELYGQVRVLQPDAIGGAKGIRWPVVSHRTVRTERSS